MSEVTTTNIRFEIALRLGWRIKQVGSTTRYPVQPIYNVWTPDGERCQHSVNMHQSYDYTGETLTSFQDKRSYPALPPKWDNNLDDALSLWRGSGHRIDLSLEVNGNFRCAPDIPNCTITNDPHPALAVARAWLYWQQQLEREAVQS